MTARTDRYDVQALKGAISLEDLIQAHGVKLVRRGNELFGLCPFHSERTASFTVTPSKQLYHCCGCGAGGDHLSFLMEFHGEGFRDAADRLAQMVGGAAVPANDNRRQRRAPPREEALPVWIKSMPPSNAPPPDALRTCRQGEWVDDKVVARWAYRTTEGALVGYACRIEFPKADGSIGKDVIPLSWQVNTETGEARWRQGAFSEPRPLYGAELLAQRPEAAVLLVEGEKPAEAARPSRPCRPPCNRPARS